MKGIFPNLRSENVKRQLQGRLPNDKDRGKTPKG